MTSTLITVHQVYYLALAINKVKFPYGVLDRIQVILTVKSEYKQTNS